ncbi:MAG: hypothetical protein IJX78_06485 [Bacilli bacterium]|nr:hypothetical protein [Bacilli bacterium]
MKKQVRKLLLFVMVVLGVVTLTGCNNYKYPSETPKIANPDEVYLTVGDYKVTKEQIYYRNLSSYGVLTLNELLDDMLLPEFEKLTAEEKEAYEDYRNNRIYGTEDVESLTAEEKEEAETKFKKSQVLQGYYTDAEAEDGLKLEYRRYVYAANCVKQEIADFEPITDAEGEVIQEEYFTEIEIENALSTAYPDESKVILLTFRSELEAKALMEEVGIYTDVADYRGWRKLVVDAEGNKTAGDLMTQTEVYDAFIKMYNTLYGHLGCSIKENAYTASGDGYKWDLEENANGYNNFDYTYTSLSKVSSVIAKKVFDSLTTKNFVSSYTTAPNKYLSKYFLALEVEETVYEDIEHTDAKLVEQLIENKLTSSVVEYYLYENRLAHDLVIYDRGLEIAYASEYDVLYSELGYEKTYEKTDLTSGKNVATLTINGEQYSVTADSMYTALTSAYGVSTGIGFISQYILLDTKYNEIFNIVTGEILDQEAYDALYEEEIEAYKEELEAGTFASVGYPKGYGWENFLRDRFGVLSDLELLALGSVYDTASEKFAESLYTFSNSASATISGLFSKVLLGELDRAEYEEAKLEYVAAAENTIQYQMQKIVDEYYNVDAYTVKAFIDLDHNGTADELTEEAKVYAETLVDYLLLKANDTSVAGATYLERINTLVKKYNLASINDNTVVGNTTFAELKKQGIEVSVSAETAYTSKASADDEFKAILKNLWNKVKDGELSSEFTSTTKSLKFENELISDFYTTETAVQKVVVTEATDYTYVVHNTKVKQVLPTEELIDRYLIVQKDDEEKTDEELELSVSTKERAAVQAYYTPALEVFTSDDAIADALIEARDLLIEKGTVNFADSKDLDKYYSLMEYID